MTVSHHRVSHLSCSTFRAKPTLSIMSRGLVSQELLYNSDDAKIKILRFLFSGVCLNTAYIYMVAARASNLLRRNMLQKVGAWSAGWKRTVSQPVDETSASKTHLLKTIWFNIVDNASML